MKSPFSNLIQELDVNSWIEEKKKLIEEQGEDYYKQQYLQDWTIPPDDMFAKKDINIERERQIKVHMNFVDIKF